MLQSWELVEGEAILRMTFPSDSNNVADWERHMASVIEKTNRSINDTSRKNYDRNGTKNVSNLRAHGILPAPPPPRHNQNLADPSGQCGGYNHPSYQSAAIASFHATRGVGITRPMPKSVEADLTRRIESSVRRSVELLINDKLSTTERAVDIVRGQMSAISDNISRQSREVGSFNTALSSQERVLDALKHEVNSRRGMLVKLESFSVDDTTWHNSVNQELALLKQKTTQYREDIIGRATSAELKELMNSVHLTATSSVDAAVTPIHASIQKHFEAVQKKMQNLENTQQIVQEELDVVGICGSNKMGTQSLNDGIKSIVAHGIAIAQSGEEKNLNTVRKRVDMELNNLREDMTQLQREKDHSRIRLEEDSDTMDLITTIVMRAVEESQRTMQGNIESYLSRKLNTKIESCQESLVSIMKTEVAANNKAEKDRLMHAICAKHEKRLSDDLAKLERKLGQENGAYVKEEDVKHLIADSLLASENQLADKREKFSASIQSKVDIAIGRINATQREQAVLKSVLRDTDEAVNTKIDMISTDVGKISSRLPKYSTNIKKIEAFSQKDTELRDQVADLDQKVQISQSLCEKMNAGFDIIKALGNRVGDLEQQAVTHSEQQVEIDLEARIQKLETSCIECKDNDDSKITSVVASVDIFKSSLDDKFQHLSINIKDGDDAVRSDLQSFFSSINQKIVIISKKLECFEEKSIHSCTESNMALEEKLKNKMETIDNALLDMKAEFQSAVNAAEDLTKNYDHKVDFTLVPRIEKLEASCIECKKKNYESNISSVAASVEGFKSSLDDKFQHLSINIKDGDDAVRSDLQSFFSLTNEKISATSNKLERCAEALEEKSIHSCTESNMALEEKLKNKMETIDNALLDMKADAMKCYDQQVDSALVPRIEKLEASCIECKEKNFESNISSVAASVEVFKSSLDSKLNQLRSFLSSNNDEFTAISERLQSRVCALEEDMEKPLSSEKQLNGKMEEIEGDFSAIRSELQCTVALPMNEVTRKQNQLETAINKMKICLDDKDYKLTSKLQYFFSTIDEKVDAVFEKIEKLQSLVGHVDCIQIHVREYKANIAELEDVSRNKISLHSSLEHKLSAVILSAEKCETLIQEEVENIQTRIRSLRDEGNVTKSELFRLLNTSKDEVRAMSERIKGLEVKISKLSKGNCVSGCFIRQAEAGQKIFDLEKGVGVADNEVAHVKSDPILDISAPRNEVSQVRMR